MFGNAVLSCDAKMLLLAANVAFGVVLVLCLLMCPIYDVLLHGLSSARECIEATLDHYSIRMNELDLKECNLEPCKSINDING